MHDDPSEIFTGPDICRLAAHQVVDLLKKRELSPHDLLDAARARIGAVEPAVNAMPTTCFERAQGAIDALDTGNGDHPGWLGGLPLGIKDLRPVAGVRTTFGSAAFADNIPDKSDPLVLRLESRGGVVVGKTNPPEMGAGANTFNAVFGMTRNPWDTSLNAGGSSGGAAVSLATGEVWLSHGSDLAGSLRTPAAFCGVVGFRPSPGITIGGPATLGFHTEAVQGPMARSVRDCALFLDTMAGFDAASPISFPAPDMPYQQSVLQADARVRIAYSADLNGFAPVSQEIDGHIRSALQQVQSNGGTVAMYCPALPELDKTYRVLRAMLWAANTGRLPAAVQSEFKATLAKNIEYGRNLSADDIYDAQISRTTQFNNMHRFLQDFDVLACPVIGLMPGPVEQEYPTEIGGRKLTDYIDWLKFSFLAATTGLPAVAVPVGLSSQGMPVAVQRIGPPRGEARLLQVARAVEVAVGGPLGPIDPNVTHL